MKLKKPPVSERVKKFLTFGTRGYDSAKGNFLFLNFDLNFSASKIKSLTSN